jgi:hypothetical protein
MGRFEVSMVKTKELECNPLHELGPSPKLKEIILEMTQKREIDGFGSNLKEITPNWL